MLLNNVGNIKKLICVVYKKNVPFLDRNKLYYMYLLTTTSVHGVDWPTCTCVLISQVCAFFVFLTNIKGLYKFTIFNSWIKDLKKMSYQSINEIKTS